MIQITTAAKVLAQLRARQAVKRELQKHGLKVSAYSARDISVWARLYLEDHHEALIPPAIEQARAMILSGDLGKRAQRELRANISSDAQTQKA
ncbi:MAG: hypothetical protein ACLQF4_00235 [Xanthobacteraceae bacterium]